MCDFVTIYISDLHHHDLNRSTLRVGLCIHMLLVYVQFTCLACAVSLRDIRAMLLAELDSLKGTLSADVVEVVVSREDVYATLLQLYRDDSSVATKQITVEFLNEYGQDAGGLTKDLFTSFWIEAFQKLFHGEDVVVPCLPLHRRKAEMPALVTLGRILSHSVALTSVIPTRWSLVSLMVMMYGTDNSVPESAVLQDFLLFLVPQERTLVRKALDNYSALVQSERELLCDLLQAHGLYSIPTAVNVAELVQTLADDVIVHQPALLCEQIRKGLPESHVDCFWSALTVPALQAVYEQQRPTGQRLADSVVVAADAMTNAQDTALYRLRLFLSSLDQDEVEAFLLFATGSIHMPPQGLQVSFNNLSGALRRPIAHTCSNHLELSVAYSSYQEFKRELKAVIHNPMCLQMTLV